jgi:hypothetical protein
MFKCIKFNKLINVIISINTGKIIMHIYSLNHLNPVEK